MKTAQSNLYFNGNTGTVWVDGLPILNATKCKIVKKPKYEEVPAPLGGGTIRVEVGHTIEVAFTYKKTGTESIDFDTLTGISLISAETSVSGAIISRIKASGITFDEQTLASWEKNKVGEIELSGQAETYEKLQ